MELSTSQSARTTAAPVPIGFVYHLVTKYKDVDLRHASSSRSYAYIKTAEQERVSEDQHSQADRAQQQQVSWQLTLLVVT
jgi:hypothetical protein